MHHNNSPLTILLLLSLLLAGEYYLLVFIDPLTVLQAKSKLWLMLLKLSAKIALPVRMGFTLCYLLWLWINTAYSLQRKKTRIALWASMLSGVIFCMASYGLLNVHTFPPSLILLLYPLLVCSICLSGLFIAPLLSFKSQEDFGVKNERQKISTSYSFNFKTRDGWINVVNPFRGIFISGGAGSGKSYSLANPIIHQAISKGYFDL